MTMPAFKKDRAYCCMEWGCHLALFDGRRWERLHEALAESGVVAPPNLRLQLSCKFEEGAVFFDFSTPDRSRRGWYAFAPVAAHDYKVVTVEAGSEEPANPHKALRVKRQYFPLPG